MPNSPVVKDQTKKIDFYGVSGKKIGLSERSGGDQSTKKMRGLSSRQKQHRPSHTLSLKDMRWKEDETHFTAKGYKVPRGEKTGESHKIKDCYTLHNKSSVGSFFDDEAKKKK